MNDHSERQVCRSNFGLSENVCRVSGEEVATLNNNGDARVCTVELDVHPIWTFSFSFFILPLIFLSYSSIGFFQLSSIIFPLLWSVVLFRPVIVFYWPPSLCSIGAISNVRRLEQYSSSVLYCFNLSGRLKAALSFK